MSRMTEDIKANKRGKNKKDFINKILIFLTFCMILGLLILYGPWAGFRNWYITSAMTTRSHKYLAYIFYDENTIDNVLANNELIESDEITNLDSIIFNKDKKDNDSKKYANEYERQILERDEKNNDYKIIKINGKTYTGYLVAIYEPERVKTGITKKLGKAGQYLTEIAKEKDALIAINGGGFDDPNWEGTGGSPLGITVVNGQYMSSKKYSGSGGLIAFTDDNKLVMGKMSTAEAKELDVRDGVTFGPFLVNNGEASKVTGNGGWGSAPRTAIGQRKDGIVLFLVIDGRTISSPGANMADLIEIMLNYGAYTAANLDGGTSTVLVVNNKIVNNPINASGKNETRPICTCFYLEKDDEDNGDYSVVKNKFE